MSASNSVTLVGRLVRDVNATTAKNGTRIARYTIAVDRGKDATDFIGCFTTGRSADFAEKYLRKGTLIAISGEIRSGQYTDPKTGQKKYTTELQVNDHRFCEVKRNANENKPAEQEPFVYMNNVPGNGYEEEGPFS